MPIWRASLVSLVGLFYVYVGMMYYFPSNLRKRKELDRLMDEAESEINEAESKIRHQTVRRATTESNRTLTMLSITPTTIGFMC